MRAKRFVVSAIFAGSVLATIGSGVQAAQTQEPVPGTPNCHGMFVSYVSTNGQNNPAQESQATGASVQELQQFVREICSNNPPL